MNLKLKCYKSCENEYKILYINETAIYETLF